jgi:hypothetical protein
VFWQAVSDAESRAAQLQAELERVRRAQMQSEESERQQEQAAAAELNGARERVSGLQV